MGKISVSISSQMARLEKQGAAQERPLQGSMKGRVRLPIGESMFQDGDLIICLGEEFDKTSNPGGYWKKDSSYMGKSSTTGEDVYADFVLVTVIPANGGTPKLKQMYCGTWGREVQEYDTDTPITMPGGNGTFHHAGGNLIEDASGNSLLAPFEDNSSAFDALFKGKVAKVTIRKKKNVLKFRGGTQVVGTQNLYDYSEATEEDLVKAKLKVNGQEIETV